MIVGWLASVHQQRLRQSLPQSGGQWTLMWGIAFFPPQIFCCIFSHRTQSTADNGNVGKILCCFMHSFTIVDTIHFVWLEVVAFYVMRFWWFAICLQQLISYRKNKITKRLYCLFSFCCSNINKAFLKFVSIFLVKIPTFCKEKYKFSFPLQFNISAGRISMWFWNQTYGFCNGIFHF